MLCRQLPHMQWPYCADSCHTVLTYAILRSFILYRQLSHCAHSCRTLQFLCEEVTANIDSCQNCADNLCATKSQWTCTNKTVHYKLAPFVINFVANSISDAVVTKRLAVLLSVIRPCQKPCRHRATHWPESTTSITSMDLGSDDLVTSKTRSLQNADGKKQLFYFFVHWCKFQFMKISFTTKSYILGTASKHPHQSNLLWLPIWLLLTPIIDIYITSPCYITPIIIVVTPIIIVITE